MDCRDVEPDLLDHERGRLEPAREAGVRAHLDRCAACARADAGERALTAALERRLPQYPASLALKRRLAAEWGSRPARRRWGRGGAGWLVRLGPALAALVLLAVALPVALRPARPGAPDGTARLVTEAVTDHLRLLVSQHPLDIQSGGFHEVKPWFAGRLDFAPVVPFEGSPDFPLEGGAVGYFVDRKAAVFVYRRRRHPISLFVVRAEGLSWPTRGLIPLGDTHAYQTVARGFNVFLWRAGELGYALVSDVDATELADLGARLVRSR